MNIPEDLKGLYRLATLYPNDRYAYERKNSDVAMLIERIAQAEQALAELRERYAFQENQRLCVG